MGNVHTHGQWVFPSSPIEQAWHETKASPFTTTQCCRILPWLAVLRQSLSHKFTRQEAARAQIMSKTIPDDAHQGDQ